MLELVKIEINPTKTKIADLIVKYYDLMICCHLCVYNDEHLWIRMPEIWIRNENKKRFVFWETQAQSDEFQKIILTKVFDLVGLDISKAVQMKRNYAEAMKATKKQETK